MALHAGQRLGPYQIVGGLGAGGMGEVYRARDPRLAREVAIKVLPESTSSDADRRRRFEQEARAAGCLSHPNVLAVHDVGEHEGAPYLVAELLEGETLRERLSSGTIAITRATEIALQIARGLAAAHEKGIVHRDLKPENVFLTRAGVVKILDFGLARLAPQVGSESGTGTLTQGTEPGTVMGTAGYMAPEQVRGEPADERADLFALGVVLFEMLAGRRAFQRDSAVETLNAILRDEPELPPERPIPPALERLVRHCLEKRPEERFQSARDLVFELEGLAGSATHTTARPASARRRTELLLGVAGLVAIAAALVAGFLAGRSRARSSVPTYRQVTFGRGVASSGRFTPDGRTFVYSAAWNGGPPEIYSARVDSPDSRLLGFPHGHVAALSAKGELALLLTEYPVYHERSATLARVALSGGTPRPVAEQVVCADWAPDGESLALLVLGPGRYEIHFPPGRVRASRAGLDCPRFSPDGSRLAWSTGEGYEVLELATDKRTVLKAPRSGSSFWWAWSARGDEIWYSADDDSVEARSLRAVSLAGDARVLDRIAGAASLFDVSREGLALIEHGFARWAVRARGPGEVAERDVSVFDHTLAAGLSADGRTAALNEWGAAAGQRPVTYLRSTDGAPPMRLSEGRPYALSGDAREVLLSPDARVQASDSARLVAAPTGPGEPREVPLDGLLVRRARWTPDGRRILIAARAPDRSPRVYVQDGDRWRPVTPEGVYTEDLVSDGVRVAAPDAKGVLSLYPLEGGAAPPPVPGTRPGDRAVQFGADGRTLILANAQLATLTLDSVDLPSGRRTRLRTLSPGDTAGVTVHGYAFLSDDHRSYAYGYRQILHRLFLVEGLR